MKKNKLFIILALICIFQLAVPVSIMGLREIAENTGLSRNAIHKNIKSVEEKLFFYEEKLELCKKKLLLEEIIKEIDNQNIKERLKDLY